MEMTSSAPPMPCGKPWLPRSASVPVSSIVCTGLVRRRQPFCGPFMSNDCESEKVAPRRTRAAPSTRLASSRKFSVPRTSSAPQRPQLEQRLAAAAMAPSGSLRSRRSGNSCTGSTVVQPTRVREDEMSDDGHQPRRYRGGVNLASLDLNLLVSLDALLQQRSVTRAAAQMGLSQPALSASLARLRRHFGDELLTRAGNEYRLTPLAVQLGTSPGSPSPAWSGCSPPSRSSTRRPPPASSPCWSATTGSRSSATRSPRCSPRRRRTPACG